MDLKVVVPMGSCSIVMGKPGETITFSYRAGKGQRMVFLYLGIEPKDGSAPIDVDKFLNSMGWRHEG